MIKHDWEKDLRDSGGIFPEAYQHEWVPAPNRSWDMCAKCGFIRRADGKNKPCRGSVRVLPRAAGIK